MVATVHRLGDRPVSEENGGAIRPPPGERLASLERAFKDIERRLSKDIPDQLHGIDDKLKREVHDLRYDFMRMEAHQEEILRTIEKNKRELTEQIAEFAGLIRDQHTKDKLWAHLGRWAERIITWLIAAAAIFWHWLASGDTPHHGP